MITRNVLHLIPAGLWVLASVHLNGLNILRRRTSLSKLEILGQQAFQKRCYVVGEYHEQKPRQASDENENDMFATINRAEIDQQIQERPHGLNTSQMRCVMDDHRKAFHVIYSTYSECSQRQTLEIDV